MNFESVRSIIDTYIKKNGVEAITGDILNNVLNTMLDDVDTAISSIEPSPGGGGGGTADLSNYYTKAESDARYLASSLLGSNTLIHSGNVGSYAFVPKSDNLVSNVNADNYLSNGAYLNQTGNGSGNSNFPQGYAMFLTFTNGQSNYVTQLDLGRGNAYYRTKIDTWSDWKQFITSDNIGSQSVASIRIGEQIRTQEALDAFNDGKNLRFVGVGSVLPSPIVGSDGMVISIPWYNTTFGAQIAIDDQSNVMMLRTRNQNVWRPWSRIIGEDDNGNVVLNGAYLYAKNYLFMNTDGEGIYLSTDAISWHNAGNGWVRDLLVFNSSGNVGIGNPTPQFELDIVGGIRATKPIFGYMFGTNNNAAAFIFDKPGSNYTGIGSDGVSDTIRFGACDGNGTWVSYNQKWKFYGDVIVTGDFSFGSDMRFKDKIEDMGISIADIANAPLFTYKWNDRDDDVIYLGSSAQYWEKIAPWLVSGDDFKSLNYATLGVAMGISLAKKTINHEERIKILEAEIKRLKREQYGS